jgi:hypothetical protein
MSDNEEIIEELNIEPQVQSEESEPEPEQEEETKSPSSEELNARRQEIIERQSKSSSFDNDDNSYEIQDDEEFDEAVKKYYRLKNEYDESLNNQKKKILATKGLSLKDKQIEFNKLRKKCINCKRPVGTIFDTKVIDGGPFNYKDRHLIALCGDRNEPCPLNIDINLSATTSIRNVVNMFEKELNEFKNQVIIHKNDLLFGYITPEKAVEKFDEIKENIKGSTEMFDLFFEMLNNITDNPNKKEKLDNLKKEFYENIDTLKSMMEEFKASGTTQYVLDAVELYKNEINPTAEKIMHKKYAYIGIDYDEDDKTYHLVQNKNTIRELETDVGGKEKSVVSMSFGMPQKIKRTVATKIPMNAPIVVESIPTLNKKKKVKLVINEE